jgi:outer membrane protein TolC
MPFRRRFPPGSKIAIATLALALGGCASFTPDNGFGGVRDITTERIAATPQWARTPQDAQQISQAVKQLISAPLTADSAVQIALLNNPALQATYAELGIAEADVVQAGRLVNPGFSFSRLRRADDVEIGRVFLVNVLSLLTMPLRTTLERQRFELTKVRVAEQVVRVAADTRRAYYRAIAAQETATYSDQVREAAEASAELARRMAAAGNFSKLDQAREQVFYAETTARVARARHAAVSERERLTQLLGLWREDFAFELPPRLPDLPKAPRDPVDLEKTALSKRLDVQAALQETQNVASSLGLTRVTGFMNVLEVGYSRNSESGLPRQTGYEIELRLPLFDWGGARVARSQYVYMQSVNRAADTAVRARSEVREAFTAYRTAFDMSRHYRDEIVPLRRRISDENVLRYSGMLISVFELLADARQQIAAVNAYIETLRDYWIADSNLDLALTGTSRGAMGVPGSSVEAAAGAAGTGAH